MTILESDDTERRMVVTDVDHGVRVGEDAVSIGYTMELVEEPFREYVQRVTRATRPLLAERLLMSLAPPRRWKRGQKLNRGGRRRSRAKHAAKMQETFDEAVWERVTAPGGMNPPDFGSPEAWALLDEIRQRVFDAPKVPYPEAAAIAGFGKDGDQ